MPSITAVTIFIFGLSAFNHGVSNLISPRKALAVKQLQDSALPALNGFSVAIIGIGIYYMLAAYQENRGFFTLTLARFISARIFWLQGPAWRVIATWEAFSAVLTAVALAYEGYYGRPTQTKRGAAYIVWDHILQAYDICNPPQYMINIPSAMKLQDIPVELRQNIFELAVAAPVAPSSPSESQHGRYQRAQRPRGYYWRPRGVWEQATKNRALSLLLVSRQFHTEVQDVATRLSNNYHVDIMFVKNYGLWTTWDFAKRPTSRYIDKVTSTIRIFDPTDDLDDRFKDSLSFRGGCGGPEPAVWAFYDLLIGLIEQGPGHLGRPDNRRFIINEIEVDVIAPTDGAAHTKLECRDDENPGWLYRSRIGPRDERVPEKRLISYMTNQLDYVFSATRHTIEYCLELHEQITESITFKLNGQEWKKIQMDGVLQNCDISRWQYDVDFRDRNRMKMTTWLNWVLERRERMKKGLELDENRPDTQIF
ncbi:hypothetical protein FACUT_8823 [Fusarium acutatum]|uniref:Uncharacterized protein n=1 Tax=Fusarium acutatum TaxID=78861 RepID=A0A8H4JJU7_9HYPO|nr:hypothetical protein FACUT_8823 [Fusarium acutatum]